MKFTTPCFVRVENAEERQTLISWCEHIGYKQKYSHSEYSLVVIAGLYSGVVDAARYDDAIEINLSNWGLVNCGTDVELFKALAAMNDENDREQYFVDDHGEWFKSSLDTPVAVFGSMGESGNACFARKATAAEIVEHFKK